MAEILADAHEWAVRLIGRLPEDVEERRPLLDELEQVAIGLELPRAHLAKEVGGATDVQPLLCRDKLGEGGAQRAEEVALARRQAGVVETAPEEDRSAREARDGLVQG